MNDTPRIACIGWGSLIWEPGELPIAGAWQGNGPLLPLEFARESGDGRITLVICDNVAPVTTLWALLGVGELQAAIAALAQREGVTKRIATDIGYVDAKSGTSSGALAAPIAEWARGQGLDGVVWTNLPCGFKGRRGEMPSAEQVIGYFNALDREQKERARNYFERAPDQVTTPYRSLIRRQLGWR